MPGGRGSGTELFTSIYYERSPSSPSAPHAPLPGMAQPLGDLLAAASARGDLEQLQDLLRGAPDVDEPNKFGRTALQVMRLGNPAIARLLLSRGADPNLRDRTGFSVLHDVARAGFQDTLQTLLEFRADVNIQDHEGNLPLHLAAKEGHLQVVKILVLYKDSQLGHQNKHGDTPCDMARLYSRGEVVQWLHSQQ
ncbi:cyclin-dependent kinase 4 inhibitor C isoform 1-T2 [Discoglossus pictus]